MKTYAYSLVTFGSRQISIGRQGENLATRIDVDVTPWKTEYPTGTVSLFVVPPVGNGYLAAIEEDGNTIRWTIRDTDTAYDGHGKAELILKDASGTVMKSVTANTICAKSVSAAEPADPPEAIRPWVEQILEAIKNGVQVEETDPTVPDWAKQPNKPTYTASEVGARPDSWTPSASDVGADAAGTASGAVATHNTSGEAHADLRALIEGLTSRLNALADSDDTTLDQLSEIVAYIKSNKALIDAVTTGKVSVSDIVDNLTTNASGKVLSAAQGVALKAMIDGIVIPTALPNPKPITINGQHYDGSDAVTVTTAEIDDTLTQSGKAADAKAVGDQLSTLNEATAEEVGQLKSDMDDVTSMLNVVFTSSSPTLNAYFEPDGLNGMYVKIPAQIFLRGSCVYTGVLADAFADSLTTSPGGVSGCVYIPHNSSLIYNVDTKKLEIVKTLNVNKNIAIFKVGQANATEDGVIGGIGEAYYNLVIAEKLFSNNDVVFTTQTAVKNAYFEPDAALGLYVSIPGDCYIRGKYSLTFALSTEFADSLTTSPGGVSGCVYIPHNSSLIYNSAKKKIEIVSGLSFKDHKYVPIFKVGMGNAQISNTDAIIGGIGQWFYLQWQAAQYEFRTKLPKYWISEIDDSVESAQEKMMGAGIDGESFLFLTDLHWQSNAGYSPYITAELAKRLGIRNIVLGGDYIGGGDKATNALLMSDCLAGYREINADLFPIFGNHDSNTIGAPSSADHFDSTGVYALINKHLKNVDYGCYCYYSYDNKLTNTRYIFLDTGIEGSGLSTEQRDWFEATLSATPAGYKILVFAHIIYRPESWAVPFIDTLKRTPFMDTICTLCDTFNTAQDGREVVGIIGGHVHLDLIFATNGGIPIILIDTDSKQTFSDIGSTTGTINEQCVSVVTVDYASRKIYVTRAGRGADMQFDY